MILEAREITATYPGAEHAALDRVSFGADPGELLAIVGPNGSGKTTLVRAMLGLMRLEHGAAFVGGRPVGEWGREALAREVGVVPQREENVFPLRVRDMVMLGRYAWLGPATAPRPADHAAVSRALARCDASDLAERPVDQLSGGEWQRVRLARAIAQEPRVLILDEPTVSLDVRHEMELFQLVRQLVEGGLAGVVITHQLNLAARFADRLMLLDRGRVVRTGSPREVLERDVLTRVFGWPVAVTTWCDGSPQVIPLRPSDPFPGSGEP